MEAFSNGIGWVFHSLTHFINDGFIVNNDKIRTFEKGLLKKPLKMKIFAFEQFFQFYFCEYPEEESPNFGKTAKTSKKVMQKF